MEEQGWFLDQNKGLVHESQVGTFIGETKPVGSSPQLSRAPITGMTKTFRPQRGPIGGNPNGIWNWWTGLKQEYRLGALAAIGLLGVIIAASQKKEGKAGLEKV